MYMGMKTESSVKNLLFVPAEWRIAMNNEISTNNPLGENPVNSLLYQFAVPSIIAMLVSSLYNIVDQFFIG